MGAVMAALHVVARPRPKSALSEPAKAPLSLRVGEANIANRVAPERTPDFLVDLGYALLSTVKQPRGAASISLQSEDEPWELGLQRSGEHVLVSEFVGGQTPRVEMFEVAIRYVDVRTAIVAAIDHTLSTELPQPGRSALRTARARLLELVIPDAGESTGSVQTVTAQRKGPHLGLSVEARVRAFPATRREAPSLERADIFSLLLPGSLQIRCASCVLDVPDSQVFLDLERLLALVEDLMRAGRAGQPLFRRVQLSNLRVTARRGPGSAPIEVGFALRTAKATGRNTLASEMNLEPFAKSIARVCADFCQAVGRADNEQERNLRLVSLARRARELLDDLSQSSADYADLTNPEPDSYKRFAPRLKRVASKWSETPAMRFLPRWVATMPGLDLSSTFLCGDRLMVGGLRETACLDRRSGEVLWKRQLRPAACVVTPSGLVRIEPDGKLTCHSLESGEVNFTCRVTPRSSGGTSGSVLYGGGLPKLLALAEGDRQVSGIDLTTGEVKWRYTGPRSAAFKLRRAGKLLIVAGGDNRIVGLDGATGQMVWSFSAKVPFTGEVTFDHDTAFALSGAPGSTYSLHRFNPWSGQPEWSIELDERPRTPLLTESTVVLPTCDGEGYGVVAYDRQTGARAWQHAPGLLSAQAAWLAVDETVVANSSSGVLLGLDAKSGQIRYNHVFSHASDCETPRRLEPVLRSGALFVPQHEVVVIRPSDGEMLGKVACDLVPDLVRVDERCDVYIAEESGHLAAFGAGARLSVIRR